MHISPKDFARNAASMGDCFEQAASKRIAFAGVKQARLPVASLALAASV
jgi:hypothetical protein